MLIANTIIIFLLLGLYVFCLRFRGEWIREVDKKEHKLCFLYPVADTLILKLHLERYLYRDAKITDSLKALYITKKPELQQRMYWCSKIAAVYAILTLSSILSLLVLLGREGSGPLQEGRYLTRPEYGEGNTKVDLTVTLWSADKDQTSQGLVPQQEITLDVTERVYAGEELSKLFAEAVEFLKKDVLGSNKAADSIYEKLKFRKAIPGTGITVDWKPSENLLIHSDGEIDNLGITQATGTTVTAILSCQGRQMEVPMEFLIMPRQFSRDELIRRELEAEVAAAASRAPDKPQLELPASIEGYQLNWSNKEDHTSLYLLFLGLLLSVLVWYMEDKKLDRRMVKRKEQMLFDYPEIINKFTLLMNAGMTVKQSWSRVAEEYSLRAAQKQRDKRYAYEEMLTTVYELKLGLPESDAYEQYGRRIGLIPYIKFCSLIAQNLKKGNKGFTELLAQEAIEAFEERKVIARRLGEEAGTKLLFPMLIMLIIVFCIILVPAFLSFRIG